MLERRAEKAFQGQPQEIHKEPKHQDQAVSDDHTGPHQMDGVASARI